MSFFDGIVDLSLQQSIDFFFEQQQSPIHALSAPTADHNLTVPSEEVVLESEDGASDLGQKGNVG